MKGLLAGVMGLLASAILVQHAGAQPPRRERERGNEQEATRHGWLWSLEEGKAKAKKTGKPLMVVVRCVP